MNKVLLVFSFLLFCSITRAQDSLTTEEPPKVSSVIYTESDIQIDSDTIESKNFPKNFQKKYTDPEFVYKEKTPKKNAWDRFKEWFANILRNLFSFTSDEASMNFVGILLKVVAVIIVVIVIYLIAKALINKEGQWIFGKNSSKKTIHYSDIEKNIHLLDFEKLIRESMESGEKRVAVRYYYLWLLKVMAQNNYIKWDIEKTNSDYLYEIQSPVHKEEFTYLSYLYNYIWYGEFEIDDATFKKAENRFKNSIKTFSNE